MTGPHPKTARPALAALAVTVTTVGCLAALSAAPALAAKPGPTTSTPAPLVLPTYPTSLVGTSPAAAAKTTESGKTIRSLTMDNGKMYIGHGDYLGNSGPTKVTTFDPATGAFAETGLTAPTEEITTFRKINGKLYAPWTDPTGSATAKQGFSTNASGAWTNEFKAPAEHVYDIATMNGSDLWMVGSAKAIDGTKGGAAAYRSTDGGATWALAQKDTSDVEGGYERYYWAAALNGKMYMQAHKTFPATPLRVFDGKTWTTSSVNPCNTVESRAVEVYNGRILCTNYTKGVVAFDGKTAQTVLTPPGGYFVLDFDVPGDGYIYALSRAGVFRSPDGLTWSGVTTVPEMAWSLTVHNGTLYLGERLTANILKVDGLNLNAPTGTANPTPTPTVTPSPTATPTPTVTPSPTATPTPTATATPKPKPTATPKPKPTASPKKAAPVKVSTARALVKPGQVKKASATAKPTATQAPASKR